MAHFARQQFFFLKTIITFISVQNFKKNLRADPELWGCAIFGPIFH